MSIDARVVEQKVESVVFEGPRRKEPNKKKVSWQVTTNSCSGTASFNEMLANERLQGREREKNAVRGDARGIGNEREIVNE